MATNETVSFVDITTDTSNLFQRYRGLMSWMLLAAYLGITLLLSFRYGFAGAIRVISPPMVSALLTLLYYALRLGLLGGRND